MFLNRSVSNRNILDLIAALLVALLPFLNLAALNPLFLGCGLLGLASLFIPFAFAFFSQRVAHENLVADQPMPPRASSALARRWLREGLRRELGEAPGAYWLLALWAAVGAAAIAPFYLPFFGNTSNSASVAASTILYPSVNLALPVALAATLLYHLRTQAVPLSRARVLGHIALALLLAVLAFLAPNLLGSISSLFGAVAPDSVVNVSAGVWPVVTLVVAFTLAATRRHRLPPALRLLAVGAMGGAALTVALAYPVYTFVFNNFVPGMNYSGPAHERTAALLGFIPGFRAKFGVWTLCRCAEFRAKKWASTQILEQPFQTEHHFSRKGV